MQSEDAKVSSDLGWFFSLDPSFSLHCRGEEHPHTSESVGVKEALEKIRLIASTFSPCSNRVLREKRRSFSSPRNRTEWRRTKKKEKEAKTAKAFTDY